MWLASAFLTSCNPIKSSWTAKSWETCLKLRLCCCFPETSMDSSAITEKNWLPTHYCTIPRTTACEKNLRISFWMSCEVHLFLWFELSHDNSSAESAERRRRSCMKLPSSSWWAQAMTLATEYNSVLIIFSSALRFCACCFLSLTLFGHLPPRPSHDESTSNYIPDEWQSSGASHSTTWHASSHRIHVWRICHNHIWPKAFTLWHGWQ